MDLNFSRIQFVRKYVEMESSLFYLVMMETYEMEMGAQVLAKLKCSSSVMEEMKQILQNVSIKVSP